ncbi:uncharacterized protein LOC142345049 [Convolutriloba macropyga]|uniref:uncharacterized protein LOC142345049 n=1 Tax=Convolutriloba macropyga TaxID=536237 RepID=UPI003F51C58C
MPRTKVLSDGNHPSNECNPINLKKLNHRPLKCNTHSKVPKSRRKFIQTPENSNHEKQLQLCKKITLNPDFSKISPFHFEATRPANKNLPENKNRLTNTFRVQALKECRGYTSFAFAPFEKPKDELSKLPSKFGPLKPQMTLANPYNDTIHNITPAQIIAMRQSLKKQDLEAQKDTYHDNIAKYIAEQYEKESREKHKKYSGLWHKCVGKIVDEKKISRDQVSVSRCFKANVEQDYELACQVNSWYDMESYGAYKLVDPRSTADAHAHKILETTTLHNGQRYDVGMVWADDNFQLTNNYFSSLVQLKSAEKRLSRDKTSKKIKTETIAEDLQKGYVVTVPDAHMVEQWLHKDWYLPHHRVINPNKTMKSV